MGADYALWVADNATTYLLRWDGATWVNDGPLTSPGGAYTFSQEPEGRYTDLVLPFSLVGNPTGSMDLVAFAVDADEGPSRGLRLWSVLPYANPVDSARAVADARGPDQPHRMTLTDRYPVSLAAGTCLSPEVNVEFSLSSDHDGIAYDAMQRIQSDLAVNDARWEALYTPYDNQYQSWLAAEYCPTDPTFPGCSTNPKELATVNRADFLITNGMADGDLPPLLPGDVVTYTLHYLNPATEPVTLPAYLYTDGDLNKPQSGMSFQNLAWVDQCPGWLTLDLQPGTGTIVLVGTVQAGGVQTVTLDIDPTYGRDGCALAGMVDGPPAHRLQIEHSADDGAPGYIAIAPNFTIGGPMGATVQGVVQDRSPVPLIELEVNGGAIVACEDATPTDGEWACAWDIVATNGGSVPENGDIFHPAGARHRHLWSAE
ncbi:MAG: hypothetical protein R2867_26690 [Caldilineaceae bacterium]